MWTNRKHFLQWPYQLRRKRDFIRMEFSLQWDSNLLWKQFSILTKIPLSLLDVDIHPVLLEHHLRKNKEKLTIFVMKMAVNLLLAVEITIGSISASKWPSDIACTHFNWDCKANSSCSSRVIKHVWATVSAKYPIQHRSKDIFNLPVWPMWTWLKASVKLK